MPLPEPLHEGDRLSGRQFLRRWDAMPDLKRAELIGGVVFMASPLSFGHGTAASAMSAWLWIYKDRTPGCETGIETTWIMGIHDVPQPDAFLRISPDHGGQSHQTAAGYAAGAPELIVEVSGSSLSRDLGVKLDLYRRSGVREYVTVLLNDQRVVWRYLARGSYREIEPGADGLLRSRVFPGLWLDPGALWDPDKSIRAAVEQGVEAPEHSTFVARLHAAAATSTTRSGGGGGGRGPASRGRR